MKKVAVLLPVHNCIEFTRNSLSDLQRLLSPASGSNYQYTIAVIDDGSTDGTSDVVSEDFPDVVLLKGDGNLWWSGGINLGAKYAMESVKADFILLWNNDIIPDEHFFSELEIVLNSIDPYTIIGPKIYSSQDTIWSMGGVFNPYTGKKKHRAYRQRDAAKYEKVMTADWLPGMGTVIPVSVINKIGYWDQINFPQYHGDSDFTYRAKLAGFKINVYPQLKIWNDISHTGLEHDGNFNTLLHSLNHIKSYNNIRLDIIFYRKYAKSPLAYWELINKYGRLFGGFLKWKILGYFGKRKIKA